MAEFIDGDLETADLLIYGTQSHLSEDLVNNQMNKFMDNLLPSSVAFFTSVMNLQKQMAKNRAIQIAKGAFRKARSLWQENDIRELNDIGDFQHAPDRMKRFIMAEPTIRALWQRQLCDGYNDICEDTRELSGSELKEYRQVMSGMIETDNEDFDHSYTIYDYDEDYLDPKEIITAKEQLDIYSSWQNLRSLIALGEEDPTSETNGWLSV